MKTHWLLVFILFPTLLSAQENKNFEYPALITCTPTKEISLNIQDGIHKSKYQVKEHIFEYIANGKFRFPKSKNSSYSPVFDSVLSNQDSVLNIYSGSVTYSIGLYIDRYIMNSNMPLKMGDTFYGINSSMIEGKCEIKWK